MGYGPHTDVQCPRPHRPFKGIQWRCSGPSPSFLITVIFKTLSLILQSLVCPLKMCLTPLGHCRRGKYMSVFDLKAFNLQNLGNLYVFRVTCLLFKKARIQPGSDSSAFTSLNVLFQESKGKKGKEFLIFFPDKPTGSYHSTFFKEVICHRYKKKEELDQLPPVFMELHLSEIKIWLLDITVYLQQDRVSRRNIET